MGTQFTLRDWTKLPDLILYLSHGFPSYPEIMPMLMICSPDKYGPTTNTSLYSVTKRKIILELPFPRVGRCCGSSHGWLVFQRFDCFIYLYNPFSGETIDLPSLSYIVDKVVLSKNPSTNMYDVEVIAVVMGVPLGLAILRLGSNEWIVMTHHPGGLSRHHVRDVIYYDDRYYVVASDGSVLSTDKMSLDSKKISTTGPASVRFSYSTTKFFHLIKSTANELLMVRLSRPNYFLSSRDERSSVEIFKLIVNPMNQESMFAELDDLGDEALFLSEQGSMSVSASKFSGCIANSVYYTSSRLGSNTSGPMLDLVHYQDGNFCTHFSFEGRSSSDIRINMTSVLWIIPTPKFTTNS
ncbi:putative protein isoform X2 [Capsicum galapagoense]